jgi:tetraacyldisaccharide 4'-kinase
LRNKLLKKIFLPKPVICVGNFVVGGQGKTPFVRYLRSVLEDVDKKAVVISNGYGGKMKSPKIITEIDKSIDCGDEALLHAKDGITVVSKNRVDAIEVLDKSHFDLILLDDGFQDPSIHKDLNIVIVDTSKGIGNNLLIPFGPMRESLDFALKKTDIVILINSINQNHQSIINVLKIWKGLVLNAEYETYIDEDINEEIIAFSGISNPDKFTYGLKSIGARVNKHFIFSDHENISEDDAKEIFEYSKFKNLRIVTTEKDLIKLKESKKDSYREKLYLSSILAKVRIRFDEAILINFLKEKKLI